MHMPATSITHARHGGVPARRDARSVPERTIARIDAGLARFIADCRARKGWTQAKLARGASLAKDTLCRIERAKFRPTDGTIVRIVTALGKTR